MLSRTVSLTRPVARSAVKLLFSRALRAQSTLKTQPSTEHHDAYKTQIFKPKLERNGETVRELVPQCASCGISLQKVDESALGFYIEPKKESSLPKYQSKKLQFISAFSKLDDEGRQFLESATGRSDIDDRRVVREQEEELICQRCHNALHHNIYNPKEHQPVNLHEVLDMIPHKDDIVHVFSAYDFPLSLVPLKGRKNVTYVMNKSDMLCGFDTVVRKYTHYFETMVNRLVGAPSKLHIVSAHTSWAVDRLYDSLGRVNHLVGFVNAGKTRLANRVLNVSNKVNMTGAKNVKSTGSSHLPALTRENITHVCGDNTVVDTPGFLDSNSLFGLIKEEQLKSVLQGRKVLVNDLRKEKYESIKGGQVLTVGGIFFLKAPSETIVQVKPVCRGKPWTFSSMEKAIETVGNPPEALMYKFSVKPEAMEDMVRYVIPPFYGTVDLIIKDIGYVQIRPTGAKNSEELFEVWAPRGVVLGVRETIEHFMTRYLKTSTKKTIRQGKDRGLEKEVLKMRAKPVPDYKVFSRLYEIPKECSDPYDEMRIQYSHHLRQFGSSHSTVVPKLHRDETRNEFWIEKV